VGIIRRLARWFLAACLVYVVTLLALTGFSLWQKNPAAIPRAQMIVCLGAGVDANGIAGPQAAGRAKTCAALWDAGAAPFVLFTGGNSVVGAPSGGQAMANVAQAAGLPDRAILVEHQSQSTLQNALFSEPVIGDAQAIILVTDAFHMPRSVVSFAVMGDWEIIPWTSAFPRPLPIGTPRSRWIYREALAIWFNLARFSAWRAATWAGVRDIDHWLY